MTSIILEYILIALLVVGLGYLMYLLRDKNQASEADYYGVVFTLFDMLLESECTVENAKKILRCISKAVNYIETNYKSENNKLKEKMALEISRKAIDLLQLKGKVNDESIIYIIRLSAALLPPTNKQL